MTNYCFYLVNGENSIFNEFMGNNLGEGITASDMPSTYANTYIDTCDHEDCIYLIVSVPDSDSAPTAKIDGVTVTADLLAGVRPVHRPK